MASGHSGDASVEQFCGGKGSGRRSEKAHEIGEEREARAEWWSSSTMSVLSRNDSGLRRLRRGISAVWHSNSRERGGKPERRGWGLREVPRRDLWACERKWERGAGGFVPRERGGTVGEEENDRWGWVGRERRREGCGAFSPRLLLGHLAPGRPSWAEFPFFFVLLLFLFSVSNFVI
jgi:hypothetical protein